MPTSTWSLQDAKNRFSAVIDAALLGQPQWVTRRGKPVSVILSVEAYERLRQSEQATATSFSALLLQLPQDDQAFERLSVQQRDVEL
ncbi:prevent-host-death family protein [Thiorhodovibrio winogradskyi]|uniref:Antitoxin n=1 Tax=Thiorhodovibrio winogradskyi TaxID=77007 RepID=A0ABZ0SBE0_9GAMM|nr:type II toxin-antitoxin system Phd/YefM family antitoxin [Thiorhodovibrio winogradskyi]